MVSRTPYFWGITDTAHANFVRYTKLLERFNDGLSINKPIFQSIDGTPLVKSTAVTVGRTVQIGIKVSNISHRWYRANRAHNKKKHYN